jgi:phosphohistidine phosphatase
MNLYLVRHGEASGGSPDNKRALTNSGITSLENSIKLWRKYFNKADYIITSPLSRTKQTAEIIKSNFYKDAVLFEDRKLAPGCSSEELIEIINYCDSNEILIVGHMPDLAYHISYFVSYTGTRNSFDPGTIAGINFQNGAIKSGGTLSFLIPPIK